MKVKLMLFAYLRETIGKGELELELEEGTRVGDLWISFKSRIPNGINLRVLFAVNGEYVEEDRQLEKGDEVTFIPPVSGG